MSRQSELAELSRVYDTGPLSNRNLIINGSFEISQRGDYSTATAITNNNFYLDRFSIAGSGVTATVQHNDVTLPNGVKAKAMKVAATSSDTTDGYLRTRHIIEDFRLLSGKTVTASMWVRTNLSQLTFRHESTTNFGDDVPSDGEWHYHTATYTMPTITSAGASANQTALAIINYTGSDGSGVSSGDYFEVAQFQLEVGDTATPFEHRSYGDELARCQRYYQRGNTTVGNTFPFGSRGGAHLKRANSNWLWGNLPFFCTMRAHPTLSISDDQGTVGSVYQSDGTRDSTTIAVTKDGSAGAFKAASFTGEAYFAWNAEAEL